jgi:FG-GAP repeat
MTRAMADWSLRSQTPTPIGAMLSDLAHHLRFPATTFLLVAWPIAHLPVESGRLIAIQGPPISRWRIPNPESRFFDWFGFSVAAGDDIVVVGAQEDATAGKDRARLMCSIAPPENCVTRCLALELKRVVNLDARSLSLLREIFWWVYLFDGKNGGHLLDIPNPEPQVAAFGWSVSALGNRIIIGAPAADANGVEAGGRVYVFESIPEPSSVSLAAIGLFVILLRTGGQL